MNYKYFSKEINGKLQQKKKKTVDILVNSVNTPLKTPA